MNTTSICICHIYGTYLQTFSNSFKNFIHRPLCWRTWSALHSFNLNCKWHSWSENEKGAKKLQRERLACAKGIDGYCAQIWTNSTIAPVLYLEKQRDFNRLSNEMFLYWVLYGIPISVCHEKKLELKRNRLMSVQRTFLRSCSLPVYFLQWKSCVIFGRVQTLAVAKFFGSGQPRSWTWLVSAFFSLSSVQC